jgi:hypothetical protein
VIKHLTSARSGFLALLLAFLSPVSAQEARTYSEQELDRLVAPIALYPDSLLSQVLMASTYPLEVVEAARWAQRNPRLTGEALQRALDSQAWDPSVKALAPFPKVLEMMSEEITWTERLGDAVLAQQADVMETVQRLRRKAHEAGNLSTTPQQRVVVEPDVIVIEPAEPEVVYVPVYNPTVVYGTWWWSDPPYCCTRYYYGPGTAFVSGIFFGTGVAIAHAFWGGFDWHHHHIHSHRPVHVTKNVYVNHFHGSHGGHGGHGGHGHDVQVTRWEHDPWHRRGVRYRDPAVRERFARVGRDLQAPPGQGHAALPPSSRNPGHGIRPAVGPEGRERGAGRDGFETGARPGGMGRDEAGPGSRSGQRFGDGPSAGGPTREERRDALRRHLFDPQGRPRPQPAALPPPQTGRGSAGGHGPGDGAPAGSAAEGPRAEHGAERSGPRRPGPTVEPRVTGPARDVTGPARRASRDTAAPSVAVAAPAGPSRAAPAHARPRSVPAVRNDRPRGHGEESGAAAGRRPQAAPGIAQRAQAAGRAPAPSFRPSGGGAMPAPVAARTPGPAVPAPQVSRQASSPGRSWGEGGGGSSGGSGSGGGRSAHGGGSGSSGAFARR